MAHFTPTRRIANCVMSALWLIWIPVCAAQSLGLTSEVVQAEIDSLRATRLEIKWQLDGIDQRLEYLQGLITDLRCRELGNPVIFSTTKGNGKITTTPGLPLHDGMEIAPGSTVRILDFENGYFEVIYCGKIGYLSTVYVSKTDDLDRHLDLQAKNRAWITCLWG